jgi:PAS domain S-box-containing protein
MVREQNQLHKRNKTFNPKKVNKPEQILHKNLVEFELSHSQLEAIFAAQNDVVILYDTKMNVYKANPSFLINYGFDPAGLNVKEVIQRVSSRWLDGRPLTLEDQPTPRALRGERITGAHFLVRKADGSEAIVETSSGPVRIGKKIVGSVTVWHDITEFKRIEKELLAHKEHELSQVLVTIGTMLDTIPTHLLSNEAFNMEPRDICLKIPFRRNYYWPSGRFTGVKSF